MLGSVVVLEADKCSVGVHAADQFVVFQKAEGLLLNGVFEPVLEFLEPILAVLAGLGAGTVERGAAMAGQELIDQSHEHPQGGFFAPDDQPLGP